MNTIAVFLATAAAAGTAVSAAKLIKRKLQDRRKASQRNVKAGPVIDLSRDEKTGVYGVRRTH